MKLLREVFLALLVTFFGTFSAVLVLVCLFAVYEAVFAGGEVLAIFYVLFFAVVSFIPAFICYKLFRKYRVDE